MGRAALVALAAATTLLPLPAVAQSPAPASAAESSPAPAADSPPAPAPAPSSPPRRIRVSIAADPGARDALARVLHELMQRLSVALEVQPLERVELAALNEPSAAGTHLAYAFIDLRGPDHAALYVVDPARDRILERRIARTPGDDELAREELGHMLLAAVEGLLSGAALGTPRSEVIAAAAARPAVPAVESAPDPSPPAPPSPSAPARWAARAAFLYELAALGHTPGFTHGPELALAVRTPLPPGLGLQLSAQYRLPFELPAEPLGMRMHAFALRALAIVEAPLATRVALRLGLGAGADVARMTPESAAAGEITATRSRTLTLAVTRAQLGVDVRLSPALALWATLAADVDLDRTRYTLERSDGSADEIAAPWRVRPALALGVALP